MRIAWSEAAIADLVAIHDYIARDSGHYAKRFIERLVAAVESLENFPNLGRVVPEGDGRHRELLFRAYRVIYRCAGQEILIVAVIHGSRDLAGADEVPWDKP